MLKFSEICKERGIAPDYEARECLASWGFAVDLQTDAIMKFDAENLAFWPVCGLSDCTTLLTTRKPEDV